MALIAIVDDSRLARHFAAACLKKDGHEVAEVEPTTIGEVMDQLRELQPALVMLDQQMPGFSGASLVRLCFQDEVLSAAKVVMLTAHHDEELEQRLEKLGVHSVLYKPISPADLSKAVAALV
jgi:CheY-like chemotaxis protein